MNLRVPPRDEIIRHAIGGTLISGNARPKWRFSIRAKFLDSSNRYNGAGDFWFISCDPTTGPNSYVLEESGRAEHPCSFDSTFLVE